jgi:hypothetical protein
MQKGQECPDIFFTDRAGMRNTECLSLGVDHGEPVGRDRQLLQELKQTQWVRSMEQGQGG